MNNNLNTFNTLFKGNRAVNITSSVRDKDNNIYVIGYVEGSTTQAETSFIEIGDKK